MPRVGVAGNVGGKGILGTIIDSWAKTVLVNATKLLALVK